MNIILVPTYNERENVRALIPRIFSYCPNDKVIVVDDNSPDGTAEEVKRMALSFPNLSLYFQKQKRVWGTLIRTPFNTV